MSDFPFQHDQAILVMDGKISTFGRKAIHGNFISKSHFLHKNIRELRRMKQYYPLIVVALGILLSVAGFLYAGFVGGIPGPDDSPAEAAHVSLHNQIGFGAVCVGVLCFLGGIVAGVIRLYSRKKHPQS